MNQHPTPDELTSLAHGDLPTRRALEVMLHLVDGCPICCLALLPSPRLPLTEEPGEGRYDSVVRKVFQTVRQKQKVHEAEREQVRRIVQALAASGPEALVDLCRREQGAPLVEALLERARSLRHQSPAATVELARRATVVAAAVDFGPDDALRLADLRCRTWIELGNALRITEDLDGAETAFDTALGYWTSGSLDETLFAQYLDIRASLHRARRELGPAQAGLAVAFSIYTRYGQTHQAGRNLLSQALFAGIAGEPELALRLLAKCLTLVDPQLEPDLVNTAIQNQIWFLVDCGRFDEARKFLFVNRGRLTQAEGRVPALKLRWVEGRIDAGRGQLARAESVLREVRDGFEALDLGYQAASVTLDLAASVLRQGRAGEAGGLVVEAAEAFTALRIHREKLMAVLYLKETVLGGAAEVTLLEEVAAFLRRAEHDRAARFEPRAASPRSW
ncbi:MAG TPA: hypothetical protein DD490_27040 [Acidobacteria bacterium]|nr:hypothetical protein [Acidobacteriota bacterium]